jgi:hypothetical protein
VGPNQTVTITYKEKPITFDITVERVLDRIAVTTQATKTVYEKGETLDLTGLVVTAYYNDSSTETVNSGDYTADTDLNTLGDQDVTITYNGQTATFKVNVYDPNATVTGVTVNLPGLAEGKVEQPISGKTTFYGTGAVFTVTVEGEWVPQTVTWSLTGQSGATSIDANGSLTVDPADHGKKLTVTATSYFSAAWYIGRGQWLLFVTQDNAKRYRNELQTDGLVYEISDKAVGELVPANAARPCYAHVLSRMKRGNAFTYLGIAQKITGHDPKRNKLIFSVPHCAHSLIGS